MSDPRFARFKTDPRFRRIRKKEAKVVVDERFKSIFDEGKGKKDKKGKGRVDKYGRPLSSTHDQENLKRFYRLEGDEEEDEEQVKKPDYARGEALLESSDEEDEGKGPDGNESDTGGVVTLGRKKPKHILDDLDPEIDLDEDNFADLDEQAAAYAREQEEGEDEVSDANRTRRIAVVNLDWDHVKAIHLYKIFSSLVSPTAAALASASASSSIHPERKAKITAPRVVRGKVVSVRVYPSEFGKERLAREEREGPPTAVFKDGEGDGVGDAEDYNEDALRKYQLERLRYYYAIVECDTVDAASHIYNELEGTELERSANVFDLSFVPDEMSFADDCRDEAMEDINAPYKPLEFTTDALRHSKVKLTWDDDDPERNQLTRRTLTRKEIEENDFRAYLASSTEDESEGESQPGKGKAKGEGRADRDKLRALLLGGEDDTLPEGWGRGEGGDDAGDVDMEITFTPALSEQKDGEETTLEKYQRKMREKKKKRKEERKEKDGEKDEGGKKGLEDDFFGDDSEDESVVEQSEKAKKSKKGKGCREESPALAKEPHVKSTAEELALVAISDNPNAEPKHFDMKAVLKAEKAKGKKRKGKKGKRGEDEEPEIQEEFAIDVKDERFKALHEDYTFAIDPSNPHFKKTKGMSALLGERQKRQKEKAGDGEAVSSQPKKTNESAQPSLKSLVESVKRKSAAAVEQGGVGKRRKL